MPTATDRNQAVAEDRLLSKESVSELLEVSIRTLDRMLATGAFPRADLIVSSRSPRWKASTVRRWIDRAGK